MSYGQRNTIILLLFFLLIVGSGYGYIHFFQKAEIENLQGRQTELQRTFDQMSLVVETYPLFESALQQSESFLNSYDKHLFPTHNPDQIYRYLNELNSQWPRIDFDFNFADSTTHDQYGIVQTTLNGTGSWRGVYGFINRIENSRPVQRVLDVQITPSNTPGEYRNVSFTLTLQSYYERRTSLKTNWEMLTVGMSTPDQFHNPFFPLIRSVGPNEEHLTDVESSQLLGIGGSRIYMKDQNGELVRLSLNDQVWLGRLIAIDVRQGTAHFRLNKGGLIEDVILEVEK